MSSESEPVPCCTRSQQGQLVAPNECGPWDFKRYHGTSGPVPIILARDLVGTWRRGNEALMTSTVCSPCCCDDVLCACCYWAAVPCIPSVYCRDCTNSCRKTNDFHCNGNFLSFLDHDTMMEHYWCCRGSKWVRLTTEEMISIKTQKV